MFSKAKILLFFYLFSSVLCIKGQNSGGNKDTIYIYEKVVVYDTVFVRDTIRIKQRTKLQPLNNIEPLEPAVRILQLDTIQKIANLLIISGNQTATIPINGIILSENLKKSESMKKLHFFGIVLFAFQNMVVAQSNYGISAGGGAWWAKCNRSVIESEFSPSMNAGFYFERTFSKHLFYRAELNYHLLTSNYSYKASVYNICWDYEIPYGGTTGDSEAASNFHQLSIPVNIGYEFGIIKPYLGVEYSFRISEVWLNQKINSFGLNSGINYSISERLSLSVNYYYGLTSDYKHVGHTMNCETLEVLETNNYNWKSRRLGLSVYYNFNKLKKDPDQNSSFMQ